MKNPSVQFSGGRQTKTSTKSTGDGPKNKVASLAALALLVVGLTVGGCAGLVSNSKGTATPADITVTPASASFPGVPTGSSNSQTFQLTNTGNSSVTISQAKVTGAGFSVQGLALPMTIGAGKNASFNAVFAPEATGKVTGSVALVNGTSANSAALISLSGTGVADTHLLGANATAVNFGNVTMGGSESKSVVLTNTGNSAVTIYKVSTSGAGFTVTGMSAGTTLTPNQTATLQATFGPKAAGNASGSITIASDASNSPSITLAGAGIQATAHTVALTWDASQSSVTGYFVYRGTISGGPYTKLNSSPIAQTSFTDANVHSSTTYFYVVTAFDSDNVESVFSNEIATAIPQ